MHLWGTLQDLQLGRLRCKGQKTMSKCWQLRDTRQDGQNNHYQVPRGAQRHAQNHSMVIKPQHTANTGRTWLQAALFLGVSAEILSKEILHCDNIGTLFSTKGPVYTRDVYALITEKQIQIGKSGYKFLHPKTPSFS